MNNNEEYFKKVKNFFSKDEFAIKTTGIEILEAKPGYALCKLEVKEKHLNLTGNVMGGVLFTLADITTCLAVNGEEMDSVTISANIDYFSSAKCGDVLYAKTKNRKTGKQVRFYKVGIKDESGKKIADVQMVFYRKKPKKVEH